MRLTGGIVGANCIPILSKEVFTVTSNTATLSYSSKSDLDKVILQVTVFGGKGESKMASVFLTDVDDYGNIWIIDDGARTVVEIKNITTTGFDVDFDPFGAGGYKDGSYQIEILDIDASVTKTTITRTSNDGVASHIIDIVDFEKTLVSFRVVPASGGAQYNRGIVVPIESGTVLSDSYYFSTDNVFGIKATFNDETSLTTETVGTDDTYTHKMYIRQFN